MASTRRQRHLALISLILVVSHLALVTGFGALWARCYRIGEKIIRQALQRNEETDLIAFSSGGGLYVSLQRRRYNPVLEVPSGPARWGYMRQRVIPLAIDGGAPG